MLPIPILLFLLAKAVGIGGTVTYINNALVHEEIVLNENSLLGLEVLNRGNDSNLYMTINDPIRTEDNYSMSIVVTRHDGVVFSISDKPIKLCEYLSDEADGVKKPLTQFHLSRVFNMEGSRCPIPAGRKRLMPYMFPPKLELDNDIGCGTFIYKTTIQSCQGQKPENCMPFITASTEVLLSGDHCSNTDVDTSTAQSFSRA